MKGIIVEFLKRSAKTGNRVYQLFFLRSQNNYFTETKLFF